MSKEGNSTENAFLEAIRALTATNERLMARVEDLERGKTPQGQLEQTRVDKTPPGWEVETIRGVVSERTGATWDARLRGKSGSPVFCLENVRMPKGCDVHKRYNGLVPDGIEIWQTGIAPMLNREGLDESTVDSMKEGMYTKQYKNWRFSELIQPDRVEYIGKPLPERMIPKS